MTRRIHCEKCGCKPLQEAPRPAVEAPAKGMKRPKVTLTPDEIDQHLDEKTILQMSFKVSTVQTIAVFIVEQFLPDKIKWLDEVKLPPGIEKRDMNCVSLVWRRLAKLGILKKMEGSDNYRRSKKKTRRGGVVWKYRMLNARLAETFLRRNGWKKVIRSQYQLPLEVPGKETP